MVTKTEEASEPIRASASKRADVSLGLIDVYKPGPLGLHLKFTIHGYDRDDRTKSWRMGGDCRVRHVQSPGERHLSSGSALLRLSDDDGAAWSRG